MKQFAFCASSDVLEASIERLEKRTTLPRRPVSHGQMENSQATNFLCEKCPTLHTSCTKQRAICASRNELEASIDPFIVVKEGDIAPLPSASPKIR